jgi:hypothetical protein
VLEVTHKNIRKREQHNVRVPKLQYPMVKTLSYYFERFFNGYMGKVSKREATQNQDFLYYEFNIIGELIKVVKNEKMINNNNNIIMNSKMSTLQPSQQFLASSSSSLAASTTSASLTSTSASTSAAAATASLTSTSISTSTSTSPYEPPTTPFYRPSLSSYHPPATPSVMSASSIDQLQTMMSFYVDQLLKTQQSVERLEKRDSLRDFKEPDVDVEVNGEASIRPLIGIERPTENTHSHPHHHHHHRKRNSIKTVNKMTTQESKIPSSSHKQSNQTADIPICHKCSTNSAKSSRNANASINTNKRIEFLAEKCRKWQTNYSQLKSTHFALQHQYELRLNRVRKLTNLLQKEKEKQQICQEKSENELIDLNVKWLDYEKQMRNEFNSKVLLLTIENQGLKEDLNDKKQKLKLQSTKAVNELYEKLRLSEENYNRLNDLYEKRLDICEKRENKFKNIIEILLDKMTTNYDMSSMSSSFSSEFLDVQTAGVVESPVDSKS